MKLSFCILLTFMLSWLEIQPRKTCRWHALFFMKFQYHFVLLANLHWPALQEIFGYRYVFLTFMNVFFEKSNLLLMMYENKCLLVCCIRDEWARCAMCCWTLLWQTNHCALSIQFSRILWKGLFTFFPLWVCDILVWIPRILRFLETAGIVEFVMNVQVRGKRMKLWSC